MAGTAEVQQRATQAISGSLFLDSTFSFVGLTLLQQLLLC